MATKNEQKPLVHVRVIANKVLVEDVATKVGEYLQEQGYEVLEQTPLIPGRFDQNEGKVYITVR